MKHTALLTLFTLNSSLLTLFAAVPLTWTVETTRAQPAAFDCYQGETLELEAELQSRGKPLAAPSEYAIYWQTNGMGNLYWSRPCQPPTTNNQPPATNVLYATFSPDMDVGARAYNCFIGLTGSIFRAAFQLRMRPGPGATPNELPLPQKVIDFAKVTVLNPPWSGVGSARPLPRYLHALDFDDAYPDAAEEYYRSRGDGKTDGCCSAVRDGGFLYRNFDYPFDDRAEFVVKMSSGPNRFASVGVAQVGTNLTEAIVTSGKPNRCYKWLPGATVDGINENGVACNINVVDTEPPAPSGGDIHPLAAVRWALDNGTSAQMAATNLAARIAFPQGWAQNFHWMIADETSTWIVENGVASNVTAVAAKRVMTNFEILPDTYSGMGAERYQLLFGGANITNAWYTRAYRRETNPPWVSDLAEVIAYTNEIFTAWAAHGKEHFRGKTNDGIPWWQSVHTSIYDITNRVLRVAVQETDDWYTFAVREIVTPTIVSAVTSNALEAIDGRYRQFGDEFVYVSEGFTDFTWECDRPGVIEAIGTTQPDHYDYGGSREWSLQFEMDGNWYWGYTYSDANAPQLVFNMYCEMWDEESGEWHYDEVRVVGNRTSTGWRRQDPVDVFAHQSNLDRAMASFNSMSNTLYTGESKVLRTGEPNQFGTGWGYFRRPIGSDFRSWRIRVPNVSFTGIPGSSSDYISSFVDFNGTNYSHYAMRNPLSALSQYWKTGLKLRETEGTYGSDSVLGFKADLGVIRRDPSDETAGYYLNYKLQYLTDGTVTVSPVFGEGWHETSEWTNGTVRTMMRRPVDLPWATSPYQYLESLYGYNHSLAESVYIDPADVVTTGSVVTLRFYLRDQIDKRNNNSNPDYSGGTTRYTANNVIRAIEFSVSVPTRSNLVDMTIPAGRVVTGDVANLFYDSARDESFRISVSNGCFYSEFYCSGDWRSIEDVR